MSRPLKVRLSGHYSQVGEFVKPRRKDYKSLSDPTFQRVSRKKGVLPFECWVNFARFHTNGQQFIAPVCFLHNMAKPCHVKHLIHLLLGKQVRPIFIV